MATHPTTCGACHGTGYLRGFLNEEGHLVLTGREGDETICTQCGGPALVPVDDAIEYGECPARGPQVPEERGVPMIVNQMLCWLFGHLPWRGHGAEGQHSRYWGVCVRCGKVNVE
jgi:hypothetical protein